MPTDASLCWVRAWGTVFVQGPGADPPGFGGLVVGLHNMLIVECDPTLPPLSTSCLLSLFLERTHQHMPL